MYIFIYLKLTNKALLDVIIQKNFKNDSFDYYFLHLVY